MSEFFSFDKRVEAADKRAMELCAPVFERIERAAAYNQQKVLRAFTDCRVMASDFGGTTGYGYGDAGRDKLDDLFARIVKSEKALCRASFMSGTHTIAVALFGLLRPGDLMVSATGRPYDTLTDVIGLGDKKDGTLADFKIAFEQLDAPDGMPNKDEVRMAAENAKLIYIQRSRGYADRRALSLSDISEISAAAKAGNPDVIVAVDNCYGEFCDTAEPTEAGADIMFGSLIKNPGGGIAPTGGYIAGRAALVERCADRLTTPATGGEIGCTLGVLREMYMGLFLAPTVTGEALKSAAYTSCLFEQLGYAAKPAYNEVRNDIVTTVTMGSKEALCGVCRGIQAASAVDSALRPEPWDMPGYERQVIMASGSFTMGSSIELSADAPLCEPYNVYIQGGTVFSAARIGIMNGASCAISGLSE